MKQQVTKQKQGRKEPASGEKGRRGAKVWLRIWEDEKEG